MMLVVVFRVLRRNMKPNYPHPWKDIPFRSVYPDDVAEHLFFRRYRKYVDRFRYDPKNPSVGYTLRARKQ